MPALLNLKFVTMARTKQTARSKPGPERPFADHLKWAFDGDNAVYLCELLPQLLANPGLKPDWLEVCCFLGGKRSAFNACSGRFFEFAPPALATFLARDILLAWLEAILFALLLRRTARRCSRWRICGLR